MRFPPAGHTPHISKTRLSKAIALACATMATAPLVVTEARADSCVGTNTTISTAVTDQCQLHTGEGVTITKDGSITHASFAIGGFDSPHGSIVNYGLIKSTGSHALYLDNDFTSLENSSESLIS